MSRRSRLPRHTRRRTLMMLRHVTLLMALRYFATCRHYRHALRHTLCRRHAIADIIIERFRYHIATE